MLRPMDDSTWADWEHGSERTLVCISSRTPAAMLAPVSGALIFCGYNAQSFSNDRTRGLSD